MEKDDVTEKINDFICDTSVSLSECIERCDELLEFIQEAKACLEGDLAAAEGKE